MLRDYLIITWLTIVAAWPWSLTVLALVALAGWQFEHWMR